MALGTFTVTIDGDQLGGFEEPTAKVQVQFAAGREFVKDADADKFVFPHLTNPQPQSVSLPYTLTLVTDVTTGVSEAIGYVVTVTTAYGGRVAVGPFGARPSGATIPLVDLASDFEGQVAESIATRAETAALEAESAAASVQREQNNGVAGLDGTGRLYEARLPTRLADTALSAKITTEAVPTAKVGGLLPTPMSDTDIVALPSGSVRVVDHFGGVTYGAGTGNIYRSTNNGTSWTIECAMPVGGYVVGLRPTSDGEVICVQSEGVWRSSGWGTGTVNWGTKKINPNGLAAPQRFSFDGTGMKFIYAEYGSGSTGSQAWQDSRYAYITTDGGVTWAQRYDSNTVTGGTAGESHVHGVCYDPWGDTFYVSEGHGTGSGIYYSTDAGLSWHLAPGMAANPAGKITAAPTSITATDDGLVIGSDSAVEQGVYGVIRTADPNDQKLELIWAWRPNRTSNLGWGAKGVRDPRTGLVYIAFKSQASTVAPIIVGGTPHAAELVWEWPADGTPFAVGDWLEAIAVTDTGGIVAYGQKASVERQITGRVGKPVARIPVDRGGTRGGIALDATSTAAGRDSTTDVYLRGVAVGNIAAVAGADSVAVGYDSGTLDAGVAVGSGSDATGSSVAVGFGAVVVGGTGVAVGAGASTTAGQAVAVGRNSQSAVTSVAVGFGAKAITGSNSVALGNATETSGSNQVAIGARHIEVGEMTEPAAPAVDKARLYVKDNGAGKTQLCVRFNTGVIQVIATQP